MVDKERRQEGHKESESEKALLKDLPHSSTRPLSPSHAEQEFAKCLDVWLVDDKERAESMIRNWLDGFAKESPSDAPTREA